MATNWKQDEKGIWRNYQGRPGVLAPDGSGTRIPYTRVSTMAKALDDTEKLTEWEKRQVLLGALVGGEELMDRVCDADLIDDDRERKRTLDYLTGEAKNLSRSNEAASYGTAVHTWTELLDAGEMLLDDVPEDMRPDVAAYQAKLHELGLKRIEAETFVVNDEIQTAGSFDGIYAMEGHLASPIGDLKTGAAQNKYPLSTCIQIAIYSRSHRYRVETDEREPEGLADLGVNQDIGLLIHAPKGTGTCEVYELDLNVGWEMAKRCVELRQWRKAKPIRPFSLTSS